MEIVENIEEILCLNWSHLFSTVNHLTITKLSCRNCLISCLNGKSYILKLSSSSSSLNDLDFELKYLIDLNEYLSNEYNVPIPILTRKGERHVHGKYWLYEYIEGKVYNDGDITHLFDEKELISLAKLISRYHQYLITNSTNLSTNKKSTTREHLINEIKQSAVRLK
jgi:hypothetical protein